MYLMKYYSYLYFHHFVKYDNNIISINDTRLKQYAFHKGDCVSIS